MSTNILPSVKPGLAAQDKAIAAVQGKTLPRLLFVDNIRVFLTVLVLLHHLMITYAGSGSWIYSEGRQDVVMNAIGSWFCTVNQAYFMGLFLLISAYFVPGAYDRKGAWRFFKDRLIRLGIPLVIYSWIIHPVLLYCVRILTQHTTGSIWDFFPLAHLRTQAWIGSGPLWFIETLLIFSFAYVLWRFIFPASPLAWRPETPFPRDRAILSFALLVAGLAFTIRIWLPIDWTFQALNLQLPFFAQYVAMFIIGLIAFQRNWLLSLPDRTGRRWLWTGIILILLFPVIAILGGALEDDTVFKGGWHWQSAFFAVYESLLCISLSIAVVYLFRRFADQQGHLARFFSGNAYTAYLIHAPVITLVAIGLRALLLHPLLKFGLAALVSVPICFVLSELIRKLPYSKRVLG